MYKTLLNNGVNYQPQPVLAGFLNHQTVCQGLKMGPLLVNSVEVTKQDYSQTVGWFKQMLLMEGAPAPVDR